ncbi:MAG TPA: RsmB/NOP family class I SAM-dependent RNA methyltransferase [Burkholderiales bacterium]|nr:RsmB/NOP family class I SAM-dependent RNA methyltransferase [Burkholderiales bacterium]
MKIAAAQLTAAADALAAVLPMTQPADAALHRFFRAHPRLGQNDRAFVAETVFGVLRRRYTLEYLFGAAALTPRRLVLAFLNRVSGISARALEPLLKHDDAQWLAAARAGGEPPLEVAAELPAWLVARLAPELPRDEILALGRALAQPAPLDLRVNPLLVTRDEVLAQFAREGIAAQPTPYSPLGVRLADKPALNRHPLFTSGKIEVQDEGSQLLCLLLAPKRREMVVDFCAGAGAKTLALGALMHSQGRLYAFDVSEKRLERMKPRLRRSGLSNVHPLRIRDESDARIKRLAGKIDRVLVDAPCSGFGTLRRNPDLKWRQSETGVAELAAKQRAILAAAATLLKPGGRLVYATCSILRAENQDVVADFLAAHPPFRRLPANAALAQHKIALDTGDDLQLWPHRHGCDGFYAAVMERAA